MILCTMLLPDTFNREYDNRRYINLDRACTLYVISNKINGKILVKSRIL